MQKLDLLQACIQKNGLDYNMIVEAAIRGMNKAKEKYDIDGGLILCCMRGNDNKKANFDNLRKRRQSKLQVANRYIAGFVNELKETMPFEIVSNQQWIDLVSEVDKDGDCQIYFEEFKEMMQKISNMK